MNLREISADAKASGDFSRLSGIAPYARFVGLSLKQIDGRLVTVLAGSPIIIGNPMLPAIHGGAVGTLLESAALFQLIMTGKATRLPKTISITIDYLRSARPVDTFAEGLITKQGRRIANVRVEAWQDDRSRPVATAHAHFLLS